MAEAGSSLYVYVNNHLELTYYLLSKVEYFKKKLENNHFLILIPNGDFEEINIVYHPWYYRRYR